MQRTGLFLFALLSAFASGQDSNDTKGQQQLKGVSATFGATYSLKNNFNFSVLSAKYSVEPFNAEAGIFPDTEGKLLIVQFAIKNTLASDNWFNTENLFTLVDTKNQVYTPISVPRLESMDGKGPNFTLRPSQGLGQPSLKDPLTIAFIVPATAKIDKIMVNQGRLNTDEEVLRYELKDPPVPDGPVVKNYIAALPAEVADPTDPSGAIARKEGVAQKATPLASGSFHFVINDFLPNPTDVVFNGNPPDEGKRFVVATMSATHLLEHDTSFFEITGGDFPLFSVSDADGERYRPIGFRKAKADEEADHTFQKGDVYNFRVLFSVPKDAKLTKLVVGAHSGRAWALDLTK